MKTNKHFSWKNWKEPITSSVAIAVGLTAVGMLLLGKITVEVFLAAVTSVPILLFGKLPGSSESTNSCKKEEDENDGE